MKFSVIIPAYNAEKTISICLRSVAQQTFADFEAIIVDDGSSDSTSKLTLSFLQDDPRFRYIFQENQGVSCARNHGMREARGDFLVFLDSDDCYTPQYLESFSQLIDTYPDYDHFWCGYQSVDEMGHPISCCQYDSSEELRLSDRSAIATLHRKALDASLWNKAYRRSIIEQHALSMQAGLSLGEDMLFNYAYLNIAQTPIVISNKLLYLYRKVSNETLDSRFRSDLKEIYDMLDTRILSYLQQWNIVPSQLASFYSSVFYRLEKVLYNTYRPENTMSPVQKRRFNQKILHSPKFKEVLSKMDATIHPAFLFAYRIGSWQLLQILTKLSAIKNRIARSVSQ